MDRDTYEEAFKILLALDECVDKAIRELEQMMVIGFLTLLYSIKYIFHIEVDLHDCLFNYL